MSKVKQYFKKQNSLNGKIQKPYYSLVSKKAGRALTIAESGIHQGTTILMDFSNQDQQLFTLQPKNHEFHIKCRKNKEYLTVQSGVDGARIHLTKQPGPQSVFRFQQTKQGQKQYIIYTYCGKVLDVCGGNKENGTQIIQWPSNGHDNQVWHFNNLKNVSCSTSGKE